MGEPVAIDTAARGIWTCPHSTEQRRGPCLLSISTQSVCTRTRVSPRSSPIGPSTEPVTAARFQDHRLVPCYKYHKLGPAAMITGGDEPEQTADHHRAWLHRYVLPSCPAPA